MALEVDVGYRIVHGGIGTPWMVYLFMIHTFEILYKAQGPINAKMFWRR